ncbi:MotA/TolQ/ExbB proton channel family protein [Phaeodactylibacter luteus]|uniref:MotA/TolQ/ExbB proton channel family protein n=1 Tax=Phaeodactylibacter luteus TaxID=1564516 RepID=A0A5C6RMZ6_9BACT|nr:MotA/TolQ/ExbB proton channel family protein [Phaeodactylibacter luteus]TXB63309.1 MotA/TolQ/ExbB proton channel family protein [Phaeodactylibacter luteus]
MRKLIALLLILGMAVTSGNFVYAQDSGAEAEGEATEQMEDTAEDTTTAAEAEVEPMQPEAPAADAGSAEEMAEDQSGYQVLKKYFIDGDWRFMSFVLVCLILGLAFCIERIITLNIATTNTDKLLARIDDHLKSGDVQGAMEVCKSTQGPTASILYEGLKNADDGAEAVEKAIVSYGSVQMGLLERGLVWISLFIAIAPMLGFMGTVIGMIQAFDRIEAVGDLSPSVVAGGIKVALLTTVFGLITAIILQIFYNYIVSKIDGIVNKMEDASIALVDIMAANNIFKK